MTTTENRTTDDFLTGLRELDHRRSDGIDVTLLWDVDTDRVFVSVVDEHGGESFRVQPRPERARDAFHHPFAYAAAPA